jgi:hypothetical protein
MLNQRGKCKEPAAERNSLITRMLLIITKDDKKRQRREEHTFMEIIAEHESCGRNVPSFRSSPHHGSRTRGAREDGFIRGLSALLTHHAGASSRVEANVSAGDLKSVWSCCGKEGKQKNRGGRLSAKTGQGRLADTPRSLLLFCFKESHPKHQSIHNPTPHFLNTPIHIHTASTASIRHHFRILQVHVLIPLLASPSSLLLSSPSVNLHRLRPT